MIKFLLIFLLLLINFITFSQTINVGLSTRPTYYFNNSDNITNSGNKSISTTSNTTKINLLLDIEIPNKKNLFNHIPTIGFSYFNNFTNRLYKNDNRLTNDVSLKQRTISYYLGYGVGVNSRIFKNFLFLNIKASLIGGFNQSLLYEQNTLFYDNSNQLSIIEEFKQTKPIEYTTKIELTPSLRYKYNFISISLGFPIALQYSFSNGKKTNNYNTKNILTDNSIKTEDINIVNYKNMKFVYDFELTLRVYISKKDKLCITNAKKQ